MKRFFLYALYSILVGGGLWGEFRAQQIHKEAINTPIRIGFWNVNNLFDTEINGNEYPEFIPFTHSWIPEMYQKKLTNTARVINDMNASILGLAEIESEKALTDLNVLIRYPYKILGETKGAVRTALLSRYPISEVRHINVKGGDRAILQASVGIEGKKLIVFVNHWKSKHAAESERILYARALKQAISNLSFSQDYILIGDFNSNYNEYETFKNDPKLNDSGGITGINHILSTLRAEQLVNKREIHQGEHYNLWLELSQGERWSEMFGKEKGSIDAIILPYTLFDDQGISYKEGSFRRFTPDYLFKNGVPFRWEMTKKGKGEHRGEGYSDHLPLIAEVYSGKYEKKESVYVESFSPKGDKWAALYDKKEGKIALTFDNVAVIAKEGKMVVLHKEGRGIIAYGSQDTLELGGVYTLQIDFMKEYNGLREITAFSTIKKTGNIVPQNFYKRVKKIHECQVGDIITQTEGIVERGGVRIGDDVIPLYFLDKSLKPPLHSRIEIRRGIVSYYHKLQIIINNKNDFSILK